MIHGLHLKKGWVVLMVFVLAAGIVVGTLYAVGSSAETDQSLNSYLNGFFQTLPEQNNQFSIFKTAFWENCRLFLFLFIGGCFRFGPIVTVGSVGVKGFCAGFTTGAMLKYYGVRGLLVNLCNLPATILFLPILILFAAYSADFAGKPQKREEHLWGGYVLISVFCFTIFCISSLAQGYSTTTFMKIIAKNIVAF